jgi:hypothetical protein
MSVKKIIPWVILVFVAYTIITSPDKASAIVSNAFGGLSSLGHGVGGFFSKLFS